jgi:hypothetical protein
VLAGIGPWTSRTAESHPRITTTLLWNRDIAPILQRRCYSCHSGENIAFSMATYREGRPWAAAIREEVLTRNMPPWPAVSGYGHFVNDASLTQRELDLLVAWADGGAPSGQSLDEEERPAVILPSLSSWEHGTPDVVVGPAKAPVVPASARDVVTRVEVSTGFKTARQVAGVAFKPGDRRVVRYATVSEKGSGRWLFTWTPWQTDMRLPPGVAYTLPAGSTLAVEIAYRGIGEDVEDRSEVGLYLATGRTQEATVHVLGPVAELKLAPRGAPARTRLEMPLDAPAALFALWPELGAEGRSVELAALLPDGGVQPLLWLKDYRSDFRSPYIFADPVVLPAGTRLAFTAYVVNAGDQVLTVPQPRLSLVRVPAGSTTM